MLIVCILVLTLQDMEGLLSEKGSQLCSKKKESCYRSDSGEFAGVLMFFFFALKMTMSILCSLFAVFEHPMVIPGCLLLVCVPIRRVTSIAGIRVYLADRT